MFSKICFFVFFAIVFLISSCTTESKKVSLPEPEERAWEIDSIQVFHKKAEINVPVAGKLRPWKESVLLAHDSSRIISLLVDEQSRVNKGDIMLSLWNVNHRQEHTPIDVKAPINGIIKTVYFSLNEVVAPQEALLEIKNYDYFLLSTAMPAQRLRHIKKGYGATLYKDSTAIKAWVEVVNRNKSTLTLQIKNKNIFVDEGDNLQGYIQAKSFNGDFIHKKYFDKSDSISVVADHDIRITIRMVAFSDSLALISPSIPGENLLIRER